MPTLGQAKTFGGVGAILGLLSFAPYIGPVLAIVSLVLILVAVNYISNIVEDRAIFKNMLISVILGIVAIVVLAVNVVAIIFRVIGLAGSGGFRGLENWSPSIENFPWAVFPPLTSEIMGLIIWFVIGIVVMWVFFLISVIFLRKSYNSIANKLDVSMFKTAALVYLIGTALAIVGVGIIIIFIASILEVVAFFSLPEQVPQPQ